MSKYLSIGQVAQIKNIHIKSLHYYDKIGILKPAYKDPYSGYRYYTAEQMIFLDIIQLFVALDIPLKSFPEFTTPDGGLEMNKIFSKGKIIAEEKMRNIFSNLERIEMATNSLQNIAPYENTAGMYRRNIGPRHFLAAPIKQFTQPIDFQRSLTYLSSMARQWHMSTNFPGGLMLEHIDGVTTFYIYIQLYDALPQCPNYRFIPEADFDCHKEEPGAIYKARENYPDYFSSGEPVLMFEVDYLSDRLYVDLPKVELQLPII